MMLWWPLIKNSLCSLLTVLSFKEFLAFEYRIPGLTVWHLKVSLRWTISYYWFSSALPWFLFCVPGFGSLSLCPPLNHAYFTVFHLNLSLPVLSFVFCSPWSSLCIYMNLWGGTSVSVWAMFMAPILRIKGGEKPNL